MDENFSWSQLYAARRNAARRFGKIFQLPIRKRVSDVLLENIRPGSRVLEVGAGDRRMVDVIARRCEAVIYRSMDVDPAGRHDFRSLQQIDETFECVFALEVVEHLPLEQIGPWLTALRNLVRPGGALVLSTPNTYYPPAYLRDATHRTPLCYDELAGMVTMAGFEVDTIVRIYHDPVHRKLLRRYLFGWLFHLIGIDFARQIVLVARRPE